MNGSIRNIWKRHRFISRDAVRLLALYGKTFLISDFKHEAKQTKLMLCHEGNLYCIIRLKIHVKRQDNQHITRPNV